MTLNARIVDGDVDALAVEIDRGFGRQAVAAIAATPRGPRRDFEVARWARRFVASGHASLAMVFEPGAIDEEIAAFEALHEAIRKRARRTS